MGFQEQYDALKTAKDFLFVPDGDGKDKKPEFKGVKPTEGDTPPAKSNLKQEFDTLLKKKDRTPAEQLRLNELPALLKRETVIHNKKGD